MKRSINVLLVAALSTVAVLAGSAVAGATTSSSGDASQFVSKINVERSSRGEGTLSPRTDLAAVALRHSQAMAKAGYIYHNDNLPNEVGGNWRLLGENVGEGPDVTSLHEAFMQSAPHRHNILTASFNQVGIGVVIADDGTLYVTEVFAQRAASVVHHTTHTTTPKVRPAAKTAPARATFATQATTPKPAVRPAAASSHSSSASPAEETFVSLVRMAGLDAQ